MSQRSTTSSHSLSAPLGLAAAEIDKQESNLTLRSHLSTTLSLAIPQDVMNGIKNSVRMLILHSSHKTSQCSHCTVCRLEYQVYHPNQQPHH